MLLVYSHVFFWNFSLSFRLLFFLLNILSFPDSTIASATWSFFLQAGVRVNPWPEWTFDVDGDFFTASIFSILQPSSFLVRLLIQDLKWPSVLTFILFFFVSLFQRNIFCWVFCFLTISPCLNFLPGLLLLLLDIVSNSFRSFVSLLIIN